jgi:hypothetical protein
MDLIRNLTTLENRVTKATVPVVDELPKQHTRGFFT